MSINKQVANCQIDYKCRFIKRCMDISFLSIYIVEILAIIFFPSDVIKQDGQDTGVLCVKVCIMR